VTGGFCLGVVVLAAACVTPSAAEAQSRTRSTRTDDSAISERQARDILRGQADTQAMLEDLRTDLQVTQAKVDELTLELRRLLERLEAMEAAQGTGAWPSGAQTPTTSEPEPHAAAPPADVPELPQPARVQAADRSSHRYERRSTGSGAILIRATEVAGQAQPDDLEPQAGAPPPGPMEARVAEPSAVPTTPESPQAPDSADDPFAMYEEALNYYHAQSYDQARGVFTEFLAQYPSSRYANNAQFYIGQSYYAQSRYPEAISAYEAVIRDYPNATKVPSAILKMGYAHAALGEKERARQLLQQVIDTYPYSSEAQLARERLTSL